MTAAHRRRLSSGPSVYARTVVCASLALIAVGLLASSARAEFGIAEFDGQALKPSGGAATQAGVHPASLSTTFEVNSHVGPPSTFEITVPDADLRDALVNAPPGLVGDPTVTPSLCNLADLVENECPTNTQLGIARLKGGIESGQVGHLASPIYNLFVPPGSPAEFGFTIVGTPVVLIPSLRIDSDYSLTVASRGVSQALPIIGVTVTFWGVPADPSHDGQRCAFLNADVEPPACFDEANHSAGVPPRTFLRLPTSCSTEGEGLKFDLSIDSWEEPGVFHHASFFTHHPGEPDNQVGATDCNLVPFDPETQATPSALEAETPSGLSFSLEIPDTGFRNPDGIAQADVKKAVVTLPQGVTINPSQAEGLGVCSPAQYESTELSFHPDPGKGCPSDSKTGTVEVHTPLLEETLEGDVFVAKQHDNPFNSLLAIYIVIQNPERGIQIKLAGKVEPDEKTGRIVTTFDDLPQLPFSSFEFKFREGARAPLVTPPTCGTYTTEADFVPWSAADPDNPTSAEIAHTTSTFQITKGIGGAPCPQGGVPSFKPGFSGGSLNNNAGSFSPFTMRLTRNDGEQDMTRFSSTLPPGVLGKLAGVSKCPDSAIALAKSKSGREEIASPSCPANSQIGRSLVGAGVGSVLTYVPGKLYLGGPFHGDPLSVIAITPAVAGPFDVGTVVVREALTLNPETAEVEVDGGASDPIPHILAGIPLKLRDLRIYVDRPEFTLNPTNCEPSSVKATLFGSFLDVFNPADDLPVSLSSRYQAANCSSLGFKPRLGLKLKGGTRRGGHPGLTATYRPRPGEANAEGLVVRLPRSAFLDQSHIRTICTRVQFAADACPKGSQYGYIKATTPLLDEPLQGPVYLRSSNHKLPDLVFDLHGLVDIEVATRIDSVRGGVRASVDQIPDAPISKVVLRMQGAKKGLIINSRDLCAGTNRANARFTGQNGKPHDLRPVLRPVCGGKRKR
jgi:hypothetical protein